MKLENREVARQRAIEKLKNYKGLSEQLSNEQLENLIKQDLPYEIGQREQDNGIDLTPIPVGGRNGPRVGY